MGTWDIGPFDNDTAADFCGRLDDTAAATRADVIREVLSCVTATTTSDFLDSYEAEKAVAAAALIAAQCPGGDPARSAYGPEQALPDLTGLRELARQALDRVLTEPSELLELWEEGDSGPWRASIRGIQAVIGPEAPAVAPRAPGDPR
ncbi:DUF4259 domain-containing protein [Streptomyces sp. NPDC048603]|uniref:DUF4259 domain-containing protein n=1 Tax=Streptomyces sp. NPDC048603 TaxID=3365577 RepID=UPI00372414E3